MTKKKDDLAELKKLGPAFVYGLDKEGKTRGGRYPVLRDDFVSAVMDMNFQVLPVFDELAPLVAKLPLGRIYSSGKVFIPPIRRPLFDKLEEAHRKMEAEFAARDGVAPAGPNLQPQPTATSANNAPETAVFGNLPNNWDAIAVGDMVVAPISPEEGWWSSIVTAREGDLLTLRYRDYPKKPTLVRHISTIARVYPASTTS